MGTVTLHYTIEFTVVAEDDDEDKADVDEKIQEALKRLGADLRSQVVEEID